MIQITDNLTDVKDKLGVEIIRRTTPHEPDRASPRLYATRFANIRSG